MVMIVIAFALLSVAYFFVSYSFKPSPTGIFHCICDIPGYGEKEAIVTVQIQGENWGASALKPTEISLNVFGYIVPCECETA